jgi:hypothetical protein
MLSAEAIREFQMLFKKEFHEDITPERAAVMGTNLILLYKSLLTPLPPPPTTAKTGQIYQSNQSMITS